MKYSLIAILSTCALLFGCAREPMSVRMVRSEMERCPSAAELDGMAGKLKWNYTTGLELLAFLDSEVPSAKEYVDAWYDAIIAEDGNVGANYKRSNYNVDHICPARTLFKLYDLTGKEKYRAAIDSIYMQVCTQPRTETGNFWHKKIYPYQLWLDGLYMAQPFYAMYSAKCVNSIHEKYVNFDDIADQFRTTYSKCYDYSTSLPLEPVSGPWYNWEDLKNVLL